MLVAAAEEERFSRRKHHAGLPVRAVRWLLDHAGATPADIDLLAVGEDPVARHERRRRSGQVDGRQGLPPTTAESEAALRRAFGVSCPVRFVPHHDAHAASAFHLSGMGEAAVLVVDGVGEVPTTTIGHGRGTSITTLQQVDFPHSLGLLYATVTAWLGMRVNHDEYKVMGLAAHGRPRHRDVVEAMCPTLPDGTFRLDPRWFAFLDGERMFSDALVEAWGPARTVGAPLEGRHADVAASVQAVLEDRLLALARRARELTGADRLCAAGGVMLNAVANGRIVAEAGFADVVIQPVAGDAGTALGAATVASTRIGVPPVAGRLRSLRLGPAWSSAACERVLADTVLSWTRLPEADLLAAVVDLLAAGKVVGWFHGRMELGPRALGGRSILADPRDDEARRWINAAVKEREGFRPLAPIVHEDAAPALLGTDRALPFMNEVVAIHGDTVPAVTHVDGTARPQTVDPRDEPRLAALLEAWHRRSGVAVLVNTSFNHASEPIVCSPDDALRSAVAMRLDAVVLEDLLVADLPADLAAPAQAWGQVDQPVTANLYPL